LLLSSTHSAGCCCGSGHCCCWQLLLLLLPLERCPPQSRADVRLLQVIELSQDAAPLLRRQLDPCSSSSSSSSSSNSSSSSCWRWLPSGCRSTCIAGPADCSWQHSPEALRLLLLAHTGLASSSALR
jgi:hypothetical protein